MKTSFLTRRHGFTLVEVVGITAVVVVMGVTVLMKMGNTRDRAMDAEAASDAHQLQLAFDRAVMNQVNILTNDSIASFADAAYRASLITKVPETTSLSRIHLAEGTHITNQTAMFVTVTNASIALPPPQVTLVTPAPAGKYYAGVPVNLMATVSSMDTIMEVTFYSDGAAIAGAVVTPYSGTYRFDAGTHTIQATARTAGGLSGSATATITVLPNTPPVVQLNEPAAGSYPYTTPLSLRATASDPDPDGQITRLEIFAGTNSLGSTSGSSYSSTWRGSPGVYQIAARATDNASSLTTTDPVQVTLIPNTPPTVTLTSPADGQHFLTPTTVPFRVTAVADGGPVKSVVYTVNGTTQATITKYPFGYDWESLVPSTYSIRATAFDNAGVQGNSATVNVTVSQDTPPEIRLLSPANNQVFSSVDNVLLSATATDADDAVTNVFFYANNQLVTALTAGPYQFNWKPVAGSYNVFAVATDGHNASTRTATNHITVSGDKPPTVVITYPANNATFDTRTALTVTANASDPDDGVAYVNFLVNGIVMKSVTQAPYQFSWVDPIIGTYQLQAVAYDNSMISTKSDAVTVFINQNIPPSISLNSPSAGRSFIAPEAITIQATASDADGSVSNVQLQVVGVVTNTLTTKPYSMVWNVTNPGNYTIAAVATDDKGASSTASADITVNPNQLPTVTLVTPSDGAQFTTPVAVTIQAIASDPDGSITRVDLQDSKTNFTSLSRSPYSFSWNAPAGGHLLRAVAYDDKGGSTATPEVGILVLNSSNQAPTVTLTSPANGATYALGNPVLLSGTASDSDGSIAHVDFMANGTVVGSLSSAPYSYSWTGAAYGSYRIQAVAYDNNGASTASSSAQVQVGINQTPTISWVAPTDGYSFIAPADIPFRVSAADADDGVKSVTYSDSLSAETHTVSQSPFAYTWKGMPAGDHTITATVSDTRGATAAASLHVSGTEEQLPTVSISAPKNGDVYTRDENISVTVAAASSQPGNAVSRIEVYVGATLIFATNQASAQFTWSTNASGSYSINAKAYDSLGGATQSSPVGIQIYGPAAPTVSWTSPHSGDNLTNASTVSVALDIDDVNFGATIDRIDLYQDGAKILSTNSPLFDFTAPTNGTHSFVASVADSYGMTGNSTTLSLSFWALAAGDLLPPTVSISSPANAYTFPSSQSIGITANASVAGGTIAHVDFLANSNSIGSVSSSPYSLTWKPLASGDYILQATAYTGAGQSATSKGVKVTALDNDLPAVSLTQPVDQTAIVGPANLSLGAYATDNQGVSRVDFKANNNIVASIANGVNGIYTAVWTNCDVGDYGVQAIAYDIYNAAQSTVPITIHVSQNRPPTISFQSPSNGTTFLTPGSVQISLNAADPDGGVASVTVLTNGTTFKTLTDAPYVYNWNNPPAGDYALTAYATDTLGLSSTPVSSTIHALAAVNPTVAWQSPSAGTYQWNNQFTLHAVPSDPQGFASQSSLRVYYFDNGTNTIGSVAGVGSDNNFTISPYQLDPGVHILTARTTNTLSGLAGSSSVTVTVQSNSPPTITLTPTNNATISPGATVLTATTADPDGDAIQVVYYLDSTSVATNFAGPYNTTVNMSIGTHTIWASASSSGYAVPSTTNTIVVAHTPPSIVIASPASGSTFVSNAPVLLSVSAQAYDGYTIANIDHYLDGTKLGSYPNVSGITNTAPWTGSIGSHTYKEVAIDSHGTAGTNSVTFTISPYTAPLVSLVPTNGTLVSTGACTITATATDQVGQSIAAMSLWLDGTKVSTNSSSPLTYSANLTAGTHTIYASASDVSGTGYSSTNTINAQALIAPVVNFTNYNGFAVRSSVTQDGMPLIAVATSAVRTISSVKFYDNGSLLGSGSTSVFTNANYYALNWQNASVGTHPISVIATDNLGLTTTNNLNVTVNAGYSDTTGMPVGSPTGNTVWNYYICPIQSSTPASSKSPLLWLSDSGVWKYAYSSAYPCPQTTLSGSLYPGDVSIGDALVSFTAPSTGTLTVNGNSNLNGSGTSDGVQFRFLNGNTQVWPSSGWQNLNNNSSLYVNASFSVTAGNIIYLQVNCKTGNAYDWFSFPFQFFYASGSASAPTVTIGNWQNGDTTVAGYGTNIAVTATDSNQGGTITALTTKVDGTTLSTVVGASTTVSWTPAAGSHTIQAIALNNFGQAATNTVTITAASASGSVAVPCSGGTISVPGSASLVATVNPPAAWDPVSAVTFYIDGTAVGGSSTKQGDGSYATTWTTASGSHTIYAKLVDTLGLASYTPTNSFTVSYSDAYNIGLLGEGGTATDAVAFDGNAGTSLTAPFSITENRIWLRSRNVYELDFWAAGGNQVGYKTSTDGVTWSSMVYPTYTANPISVKFATPQSLKGVQFYVGGPSGNVTFAEGKIYSDVINAPPNVSITSPVTGTSYSTPGVTTITPQVDAGTGDSGDYITKSELLVDGAVVATSGSSPWTLSYTIQQGTHNVQVRATDSYGKQAVSSAISLVGNWTPTSSANLALSTSAAGGTYTPSICFDGNFSTSSSAQYGVTATRIWPASHTVYSIAFQAYAGAYVNLQYTVNGSTWVDFFFWNSSYNGTYTYTLASPTSIRGVRLDLGSNSGSPSIGDLVVYGQ